jgi:serine/threonine-protein kinase RsbW
VPSPGSATDEVARGHESADVVSIDFEQTLGTDLAAIAPLADAFSAWADAARISLAEAYHVNVVFDELVTNTILHGLGEGRPGRIRVRARLRGDVLEAELRDDAPAFNPFEVPPPSLVAALEERAVGGLGVHFVRTLMDEHAYAREGDENVVSLRKRLKDGTT